MREDAWQRATEFLKELYAAGDIDASRLDDRVISGRPSFSSHQRPAVLFLPPAAGRPFPPAGGRPSFSSRRRPASSPPAGSRGE
jgi:hypothetical protein